MVSKKIRKSFIKKVVQQAGRKNHRNIYYAKEKTSYSNEILLECTKMQPNTNEYACMHLKTNVELALLF